MEKDDFFRMYKLNMDMMIKTGRKLTRDLAVDAIKGRDTIWKLMKKRAQKSFWRCKIPCFKNRA
jgi:hypothetical protein